MSELREILEAVWGEKWNMEKEKRDTAIDQAEQSILSLIPEKKNIGFRCIPREAEKHLGYNQCLKDIRDKWEGK